MKINIQETAGFCWGVVKTIDMVEETLEKEKNKNIYVLGNIIHNPQEINRLEQKGLKTIAHSDLEKINPETDKVIIRAHGEPPSTYQRASDLGINIVDATCPLVTALQKRVKKYYDENFQIIIFGKKEHAEVIGLRGVCNDTCIVIKSVEEALEKVDFSKKSILIAQTTVDKPTFYAIKDELSKKIKEFNIDMGGTEELLFRDTLCKYVTGREDNLRKFASENDVIIFVAGRDSSNGKSLCNISREVNPKTYFIEEFSEINYDWINDANSVGITGATSTPQWYMHEIGELLDKKYNQN